MTNAIRVWVLLEKHWEYDDSFYDFRGHSGAVRAICLSKQEAEREQQAATASFVRDQFWSMERWDGHWGATEAFAAPTTDAEARVIAEATGIAPFTIQEIVVTTEFLQAAGLSPGQRTQILRALGKELRTSSPRAADHLESHEEEQK